MWRRDTNMRHMSWVANQIIDSKEHKIIEYVPENVLGFFCPECGRRFEDLVELYVYIWTTCGTHWHWTSNTIMCKYCHHGVQERVTKRLAKRNKVVEDASIAEFRNSVKRLKKQLKLAKKVGIYS